MNLGQELVVNFAAFGGPVFVGRDKGIAARQKASLDEIDKKADAIVVVKIPDDTYSVNSSFFLGLFGKSIRKAGSREAFLKKFHFQMPDILSETVESGIERALFEKGLLLDD